MKNNSKINYFDFYTIYDDQKQNSSKKDNSQDDDQEDDDQEDDDQEDNNQEDDQDKDQDEDQDQDNDQNQNQGSNSSKDQKRLLYLIKRINKVDQDKDDQDNCSNYLQNQDVSDISSDSNNYSDNDIHYSDNQKTKNKIQKFSKPIFVSKEVKLNDDPVIQKAENFLKQCNQNAHPYSNTVIFRVRSQHPNKKQHLGLGSGIVVTIGNRKYITSVCHNFYKNQQWYKSFAFLKKESHSNNIRKKMQINQQMLNYQNQYLQTENKQNQIVFIDILSQTIIDFIKYNKPIQIRFDWNSIKQQEVYLMAFPFSHNQVTFDMKQIENSCNFRLHARKINATKLINKKKYLIYQSSTESGQSGGALLVYSEKEDKYYLIGLHVGADQNKQFNLGVLFTSDLKSKFPNIFLKRDRPGTSQTQSFQQTKKLRIMQGNDRSSEKQNKSQNILGKYINYIFAGKIFGSDEKK